MAKSFIPQYVRQLNRLNQYIAKHQGTMQTYTLTTAQAATFASVQTAAAAWSSVPVREQP